MPTHRRRQRPAVVVNTSHYDYGDEKIGAEAAEYARFQELKIERIAWFEELDERCRRELIESLLESCNSSEIKHIRNIALRRAPIDSDPVRVFDRNVCIRIFRLLDPRSLSRASCVCWQWNSLATLDDVWKPKCICALSRILGTFLHPCIESS